jgi:hypothetical protein
MRLPVWALKGRELLKWQRLHGIFLYDSQRANVLYLDHGEPVAAMFMRPLVLSKENRAIFGTFKLDDEAARKHIWVVGRYDGGTCSFVVSGTLEQISFVMTHPQGVNWFDLQARERVKKLLAQGERNKSWQKLESTSQLQEPSEWLDICSTSTPSQPPKPSPATSAPPQSAPTSRLQPALIG